MSNLVHNEQVKLSATFLNNLGVAVLVGVFLIPTFYTRHTMLQQALSIGVGLAAVVGLRTAAHWWLRRLREGHWVMRSASSVIQPHAPTTDSSAKTCWTSSPIVMWPLGPGSSLANARSSGTRDPRNRGTIVEPNAANGATSRAAGRAQ